jgi:hypothetical protein
LYSVRPAATATRRVTLRGAVATHHPGPPGKRGYDFGSLLWGALCVQPSSTSTPFFSDFPASVHYRPHPTCLNDPLVPRVPSISLVMMLTPPPPTPLPKSGIKWCTVSLPPYLCGSVSSPYSPTTISVTPVTAGTGSSQIRFPGEARTAPPTMLLQFTRGLYDVFARTQGCSGPRYCGARTLRGPCCAAHRRTISCFVALIAPLSVGKTQPLVSADPSRHLYVY